MHSRDSNYTFVNGAMLPQYAGKDIVIAGELTDIAAKNCKMTTTDNMKVNVQMECSEDIKPGFYEFRARGLSATTVKAIDYVFYGDKVNEDNNNNYNKFCKLTQMIPDIYTKNMRE